MEEEKTEQKIEEERSEEKTEQPAEEKTEEQNSAVDEGDISEEYAEMLATEKKEKEEGEKPAEEKKPKVEAPEEITTLIFALRTTANREDQVMDFLTSNINKKKLNVFSVIRPHGMRGYIFMEAATKLDAEQAAQGIPYARGILPKEIDYKEIEHMLEQVKREMNIKKNDIVEIISGPFKRETAKVSRIDRQKEEIVVELVEAAVPIPITLKMDAVKVIRRENDEDGEE